jgi:uncharacterized repeat protein (TIGR01451 family)
VVIALVITLGLAALPAYIALAQCTTTLTLTLNEDPHLLVDSNNPAAGPHVTTAYATITNNGSAAAHDVYMYVGNGTTPGTFNAGSDGNRLAMLSGPSYATRYIGNLAPGESKTVYWMLTYPLTYGKTYPMTIWASSAEGCSVQASHAYTTQSSISSQADRILGTVTMDPPSGIVSVGNILTVIVTGFNLGTIGTNNDTWFQPVGNADFNPGCFRLVRSEVCIHSCSSTPYIDRLYFPQIKSCYSYTSTDYAKYYFVALQEATTTIKVYQEAASGTVEKYSADYGVAAATLTTTSRGSAVTLAKSVSPLSGGANTTFTWTITYTNNSDYPVGDAQSGNGLVLIDEAIPANTTYVAGSANCSGSCLKYYSTNNGVTWNQTEPLNATSVNKLKWYITQNITAHSSGNVSFQSKVDPGVSGAPLICNSALAKIDDGASVGVDGVCANGGVDLELSKVVGPSTRCEDSSVTYTITVTNPSAAGATNVTVTDLLPTGLTYVSSSSTSYDSVTGLWTVGNLNPGTNATLSLTATVNSGTGGQIIRNTATITHADQTDPVIINNSAYIDIFVKSKPVAVADSNSPVCKGDTIQLYGGPSGMSYSWTGPGFTSTEQRPTRSSATPGMAGTYTLTVTAPDGCSDTVSIDVEVVICATPPDTPWNISPGNATCVSLPVTLTASNFSDLGGSNEWQAAAHWQIRASSGGYSYPVFDSGTDTVNLNSITIPLGILSDSSSYCWHVRYQGNLGAWSEYSSETCFYTEPVAVVACDTPVCVGKTIQLYGGPSGMNYTWTGPGFTSTEQRPTRSGATLDMAGNYTLTVTDANGCSDTKTIYVGVNNCSTPPDTPYNISPGDATCVDLPVTLVASNFSDPGGANETQIASHWQIRAGGGGYSDPVFDFVKNTGDLTSITVPLGILSDSSSYFWHVRYQGNLGAWSEYSSETLFCTKPVAVASSASPVCEGETIQLYGGPDGMRYSWTGPNDFSSFLQSPTISNAAPGMAGTYYLTVTAQNGCSDTNSTSVTVQTCATPPYRPTNISPSTGTCVGLPVTLTASAFSDPGSGESHNASHWQIRASTGGYSDPVFDSVTGPLTSITIPLGRLNDSSSYYWHVRYQGNLGAWSEYSSETFFCTNPVATASSNSPVYVGQTIQLVGDPGGMDSYSWTGPNGFSSGLQNPTIPNATWAMAGTYALTVINSNGCTDDASTSVTVEATGLSCDPACKGLMISSTEGGSVTTPGEGTYPYWVGTVVDLVASPDAGYKFVNWTGDVGTIADVYDASTTITMEGWYVITANFETEEVPQPQPPVYPTVTTKAATGISTNSTTLNMNYTVGNFSSVEVRFACKKSTDSAWSYTDWVSKSGSGTYAEPRTGLSSNTKYDFKAQLKYDGTVIEGTTLQFTTAIKRGCFIATAAYGTPTAEQIDVLREFRDVVLLESTAGSQFVALYYQLSPPVADFIARNEFLRALVRELLVDPIVWVVEATGDIWRN